MTQLTIVTSVYGQPAMLEHNLTTLSAADESVREVLKVIVVDDCGDPPVGPELYEGRPFDIEVYRVTEDKPWNQMGARNLGMDRAPSTWCLMIDPDMVFGPLMLARVLGAARKMRRGMFLKYGLRHADKDSPEVDMTSPNTYLIHRDDFFAAGGYDEDFAGHKGWSDVQMYDVLRAHLKMQQRKDIYAMFHSRESFPDADVKISAGVDRSTGHNRKVRLRKHAEARRVGGWKRWVKTKKGPNLRAPWVKVYPAT